MQDSTIEAPATAHGRLIHQRRAFPVSHSEVQHPLHHSLMALHMERRKLIFQLENAALDGQRTEEILIRISENRGETRATLRFLNDEVQTRPVDLTGFGDSSDLTQPAELNEVDRALGPIRALVNGAKEAFKTDPDGPQATAFGDLAEPSEGLLPRVRRYRG